MDCIYNCSAEVAGIDWPAWVQAVGSVIAIFMALFVPWNARRHALNDEKAKEQVKIKVAAGALYPALQQFRTAMQNLLAISKANFSSRQTIPEGGIARPVEFDQFREQLYLLGALGNRVNRVIGKHDHVRNASIALRTYEHVGKEFHDRLNTEIPSLMEDAQNCIDELFLIDQARE